MTTIFLPTKKLAQSDNYVRPEKTITESLQNKKNIEEQLQDFEEINNEDLNFINLNTQLKYISYDKVNNKEQFRFGGLLRKIAKEYIILAGKEGLTFSVQRYTKNDKNEIIHNTRFFKKISKTELIESKLTTLQEESLEALEKQASIISKQKKEIMELKKKLKNG